MSITPVSFKATFVNNDNFKKAIHDENIVHSDKGFIERIKEEGIGQELEITDYNKANNTITIKNLSNGKVVKHKANRDYNIFSTAMARVMNDPFTNFFEIDIKDYAYQTLGNTNKHLDLDA